MTERGTEATGGCPSWCRDVSETVENADGVHAHVSEDVLVGDDADPMVARMIQLAGSGMVRVVIGEQVVSVEEAQAFAHTLLRLASGAQLAEPGLGFVVALAERAGLSTNEMALAAGVDAGRLRAQSSGERVLTVREFDRLALTVAQLVPFGHPKTASSSAEPADVETDEAIEPVA